MLKIRRIASHVVWSPQWQLRSGILSFDEEGCLVGIEQTDRIDAEAGVEFYNGILVPGFVNAHCHLELSYLRGALSRGGGLVGFVREIAEKRSDCCRMDRMVCADFYDAKMYSEGISAVGDLCNDDTTFGLKTRSRIQYANFCELFGLDALRADEILAHGITLTEQCAELGLSHSLTPHATYSVGERLFRQIVSKLAPGSSLSIHFMESVAEQELFQHRGPLWERYQGLGVLPDFLQYESPAARLVALIPAETPLLLVHNTFVTEADVERIESHFKKVTWVLCPRSNAYIEQSLPPVGLLQRKGCRMALGTDSLSSNDTLSLLDELKFLQTKFPALSLFDLIGWASLGGAEGLGLEKTLGAFEVGKKCGAALIEGVDFSDLRLLPHAQMRRII